MKKGAWRAAVDRVEGRTAVLSVKGGGRLEVSTQLLGGAAREGAVYVFSWREDRAGEKTMRAKTKALQAALLRQSAK